MKTKKSGRERSIDATFAEFDLRNPQVYKWLVQQSFLLKRKGHNKFGIGMLWEVLRWDRMVNVVKGGEDDFTLNNNFRSRYARKIMEEEPRLRSFFDTRELRS
jgi:hypothetical protein